MKTIIAVTAGALLLVPVATLAKADSYTDQQRDHVSWNKYDEGRVQQQQPTPAERAAASLTSESKKLRDLKED